MDFYVIKFVSVESTLSHFPHCETLLMKQCSYCKTQPRVIIPWTFIWSSSFDYFCSQASTYLHRISYFCILSWSRLFFISARSVYLHNLHFFNRPVGSLKEGQLVLLLFSPYHTSLFIFVWLPFLWSSFIHICIYIVRRNLVEWQWLFFVWTVKVKGSRTLERAHYATLTSSTVSFFLLCLSFSLCTVLLDIQWCCQESVF